MAAKFVEVHHPDLNVTVSQPSGTARALVRDAGWRYVDPPAVVPTGDATIAAAVTHDVPVNADAALDAETAGKTRKTLTSKPAEIVGATEKEN